MCDSDVDFIAEGIGAGDGNGDDSAAGAGVSFGSTRAFALDRTVSPASRIRRSRPRAVGDVAVAVIRVGGQTIRASSSR